jgi:nucleotide-binding universal stress UspA family protein
MKPQRILLATDGCDGAAGAVRLAWSLVGERGATLRVVAAHESTPVHDIGVGHVWGSAWMSTERARAQLELSVRAQLGELTGDPDAAPLTVCSGPPARTIVRHARELRADLIVLGLDRHTRVEWPFGEETAHRVAQLAGTPVLAVPEGAPALPRRACVAVDFSATSARAALEAGRLVGPGGELILAHAVWPMPERDADEPLPAWVLSYAQGALERLAEIGARLEQTYGAVCRAEIVGGEPARELIRLAEREGADLVALGSQGLGVVGRAILGSVSSRVIRWSRCGVLVVPPTARGKRRARPARPADERLQEA